MFKHFRLSRVVVILLAAAPFFALGFVSDSSAVTKFNIKVDPSIELVVDNTAPSIKLNSPDGNLHQTTIGTHVTTNNPTGYTLAVLMNGNELVNQTDPSFAITPIENNTSSGEFAVNRWGILGKDSLYHPIASGLILSTTDAPATSASEPITFGVKVDASLPSGIYDCNLTVVVVANRIPYTIDTIDFMQDIDEDVIETMAVGTQYQLEDERDGKKYFVSKLADNNVWMTQNLDFELSAEGTTLNPSNSDVSAAKTISVSTNTATWGQDATLAYYKDAGALYRPNGLGTIADSSALNEDSDDQHYQLGSYYSWNAATAGSGANIETGAAAPESICPKGWKLPTASEDIMDDKDGSFSKFFQAAYNNLFQPLTYYSHTPNISDNGTQSGTYGNYLNPNGTVVTIPGAARVHVVLKYQTESCCDYVVVWPGSHSGYTASGYSGSGSVYRGDMNTVEFDINGDAVTFGFYSDGSVTYYGYYATVTGYDSGGKLILDNIGSSPEGSVTDADEVLTIAPYWMNYTGMIDSSQDWTASQRSFGYWSASAASNSQAYALVSRELEEIDEYSGEPTGNTYFDLHTSSKIDTTKGLNVRCVAKPASFVISN